MQNCIKSGSAFGKYDKVFMCALFFGKVFEMCNNVQREKFKKMCEMMLLFLKEI